MRLAVHTNTGECPMQGLPVSRHLLVSLNDTDFGVLPAKAARAAAHELADTLEQTVRLRDPITDKTMEVIKPALGCEGAR